jgi:hypothetical protein
LPPDLQVVPALDPESPAPYLVFQFFAPMPLVRALTGVKAGTKVAIEYEGEKELDGPLGDDGKPRRTKTFKVWAL